MIRTTEVDRYIQLISEKAYFCSIRLTEAAHILLIHHPASVSPPKLAFTIREFNLPPVSDAHTT